jgi:hypothetical protein
MYRRTYKASIIFLLSMLGFTTSFAAPKLKSTINFGWWSLNASWDWNRTPATADTIVIQANQVMIVDNQNTLGDVYIQVFGTLRFLHGKLTLGANSVVIVYPSGKIEGNSNSEKIRIGANEVFNGSDPDVTGPAVANSSTGAGFTPFTLPVTFLEFTVTSNSRTVILKWSTTEEVQANRFEIEVSSDGRKWTALASVQAKGTSSGTAHYTYTANKSLSSIAYYRIKEVDHDGRFMYSGVRVFKQHDKRTPVVSIGSVGGKVVLQFSKSQEEKVIVRILNLAGQAISQKYLYHVSGQVSLEMQANVRGGVIVMVESSTGRTSSQVML